MSQTDKKEIVMLNLDDIIPNKFQPREVFDDHALKELAVSIKEHGVIQPIIVREVNGKYEIIAGERRYKASALAGKTTIPAIVNNLDDKESSKVALLENSQRKNLNPIEEAKTYQKILELDEMTQEELARTMGKSQSSVANKLRLLQLNDDVKKALLSDEISERHARTLLRIEDPNTQTEMLKRIITEKINVRDLEKEIDKLYPKKEESSGTDIPVAVPTEPKEQEPSNFLNNFINETPLQPTAELKLPNQGVGEVKIIDDENPDAEQQILNYANIDDDEDEEDNSSHTFIDETNPDVKDIKNQASDIQNLPSPSGASLDSLLNIPTTASSSEDEEDKYRTPAEAIVKTAENDDDKDQRDVEDYFKKPDLSSITLPTEIDTGEPKEEEKGEEKEVVTPDDAKVKIKNLISELQEKGINISLEEMDLPTSYQIILKMNKNE